MFKSYPYLRYLIVLLLLLSPGIGSSVVSGQLPHPPDSLRAILSAAAAGKPRAEAMIRIANAFIMASDSAALVYARQAEQLALQLNDKVLQAQALNAQGSYYLQALESAPAVPLLRKAELLLQNAPAHLRADNFHYLGEAFANLDRPEKAIPLFHKSYRIYEDLNDIAGQGKLSNSLGQMFSNHGQYDSSAHYLFKAIKELEQTNNPSAMAEPLGNIGVLYFQQERYHDGLIFAEKALKLEQATGDSLAMALSMENIASMNFKLGKVPEALAYFYLAMRIYKRRNHEGYLVNVYNGLANVHEQLKQIDSAAHYLKLSIALSNNKGPSWAGVLVMGNLAGLYQREGRIEEAEEWANKALSRSEPGNDQPQIAGALSVLEAIALQKGDYRTAHRLLDRIQLLNRKKFDIEQAQHSEELRASYEADQAGQQILLLQQQQELDELKQQKQRAFAFGAAVLVLLLIGGIVLRYRTLQRKREKLMRTRIAADLHDDVGALLTQISLQGSMLEEDIYTDEERKKQLGQISHASRQAVQQMNDVVWAVDARNDGFGQLLDRMRDYAYDLLSTADIEFDFDVPANLPELQKSFEFRQNLYFIFKEALHNTVKHSGATRVNIRLASERNILTLEISDNGIANGKAARLSGHGLRNMQMRAQAMGGECTFLTDNGFCVRLVVPVTA